MNKIWDWFADFAWVKWIMLATSVVIILAVCWFIDWSSNPTVVHAEMPEEQTEVWGEGRIEGISEDIYLGFLGVGRVAEIKVQEGSKVKAGDPLIILDNTQEENYLFLAENTKRLYQAQLEILINGAHKYERLEAKALCDAKKQEVEFARGDYERNRSLLVKRAVSLEEVELTRTTLNAKIHEYNRLKANYDLLEAPAREDKIEEAKARIAIAESEIEVAREDLNRTTLRAPIDGEILSIDVEPGEYVSPQKPVLVMADTSVYRVRGYVTEYDCLRLTPDMKVRLKADSVDNDFTGVVDFIGRRMTTKEIITNHPTEVMDTKMREVWINLDEYDPEQMVVGLRVDVTIFLKDEEPASPETPDPVE